MILGVDVGNYATKSSKGVIFESKVSKMNKELSDKGKMNLKGKRYFIGQGSFDGEFRKISKPTYIQLLYAALCKSTSNKEIELALGLPLSQYKEDKENLKSLIMGNYHLEGDKEFYITHVEIYPEGVVCTDNRYEGIVVDIGGRTTDVCFIEQLNGRRKVINPISIPKGTINLENEFINALNSKYGIDLKINDFKRILKNGLCFYGKQQDITFAIDIFKDYLEDLIKEIDIEYNVKLNNIAFGGGGTITLAKPILKRLPHAEILNDAVFGNAKAYERLLKEEYR